MKKSYFTKFLLLVFVPLGFIFTTFKTETPPNIILVYFDDMGYGDLGITGATGYETPNLNDMARNGVFFSHFYSPQAVCSASRAGLLTGCYPNRIGFSGALDHTARIGLNPNEETIAELLKTKGYKTAIYGKWHLGHLNQFLPTRHGFDEYFGIPYSNDMHPSHPNTPNYYPPLPLFEGEKIIETDPDQSQFTTQFTERTLSFIKKNKKNPFFIYLAHPMPHVPLAVSDKFKGKSKQGLYGDVLMELDWSIGQIRKTLVDESLAKNTLLIVTSDNGPWINYGNHAGSTAGLREGKGTTFEGGQRVPCLVEWEGKTPKGKVCSNLASAIDILPTISAITHAPLPKNKIDGVSILDLFNGDFSKHPRSTFLYYYRRNNLEAIRYENMKMIFPHQGRTYEGFEPGKDGKPGNANENAQVEAALFDLRRDAGERYDILPYQSDLLKQFDKIAEEARKTLGDDLTKQTGSERRPIGRAE